MLGFHLWTRGNCITRESKVTILISALSKYSPDRKNVRHRGSRVIDSIRIPFQKGGERREGYPDRYILPFIQPLCIVRAYLERGYHSSVANSTSGNWHRTRGTRDAPMLSLDALIYVCICLRLLSILSWPYCERSTYWYFTVNRCFRILVLGSDCLPTRATWKSRNDTGMIPLCLFSWISSPDLKFFKFLFKYVNMHDYLLQILSRSQIRALLQSCVSMYNDVNGRWSMNVPHFERTVTKSVAWTQSGLGRHVHGCINKRAFWNNHWWKRQVASITCYLHTSFRYWLVCKAN